MDEQKDRNNSCKFGKISMEEYLLTEQLKMFQITQTFYMMRYFMWPLIVSKPEF